MKGAATGDCEGEGSARAVDGEVAAGLGVNAGAGCRGGEVAAGLGVNAGASSWGGETSGGEGVGDAAIF
jgi:hypothetical protein